eukprot:COSAG02_NODE_10117_length_2017_cov_2.911366_1_plen_108_part_10
MIEQSQGCLGAKQLFFLCAILSQIGLGAKLPLLAGVCDSASAALRQKLVRPLLRAIGRCTELRSSISVERIRAHGERTNAARAVHVMNDTHMAKAMAKPMGPSNHNVS